MNKLLIMLTLSLATPMCAMQSKEEQIRRLQQWGVSSKAATKFVGKINHHDGDFVNPELVALPGVIELAKQQTAKELAQKSLFNRAKAYVSASFSGAKNRMKSAGNFVAHNAKRFANYIKEKPVKRTAAILGLGLASAYVIKKAYDWYNQKPADKKAKCNKARFIITSSPSGGRSARFYTTTQLRRAARAA
jgi:hypothetical protein